MTINLNARRTALVAAAAVLVLGAYSIGSARAAGAAAPAQSSALGSSAVGTSTAQASGASAGGAGAAGVTVTGSGTVAGTPDTLVLSLSVTANGSTVSSAFATANTAMSAVQKALRRDSVAAKDLRTSDVSVQPRYTNKGTADGYTVAEGLTVTLHDIAAAGRQVSAAVAAGGNLVRVDGVSLDLTDTGALVSKARDNAFADAKAKAEQYAHDAGRGLGPVLAITEQDQQAQPQPFYGYAAAAGVPSTLPVAAGSQDVVVQVTVTFGLG